MKKRWYDYLWIASSVYFLFGFVNILFAWLGLVCFFLPLIISVAGGGKAYCNRYCGRGQLFALLGGRLGLSRKKDPPKFLRSKWFRYGFLAFFFIMFFQMLWNTWLVFEGAQGLHQVVKLLWTIKLPWQWAYHGETVAPWRCAVCFWLLQRDAHFHRAGPHNHGAVQAAQLVRLLPHGHDDAAHLQSESRQKREFVTE